MRTVRQNDKITKLLTRAAILLIVPAILFTGCKNTAENDTISETDSVQTNDPYELSDSDMAAVENSTEDKNASVQSVQTAISRGTPILSVETKSRKYYYGDKILYVHYDEISLSGNGFDAVAQTVSEWNKQDIEQIDNLRGDVGYTASLSSMVDCTRMDNSVISFRQQWHEPDGFTYYRGINFDVADGRQLVLADMLLDEEGFIKKATEIAVEKLLEIPDADKLPSGYALDVAHDFTNGIIDSENKWNLNACGIVYSYTNFEDTVRHGYIPNHHEDMPEPDEAITEAGDKRTDIASYLPGNITITIPYEDVAEYMKPAYCGIQGAGVAQFSVNEPVRMELSNRRILNNLSWQESSGSDLTTWDTISITIAETGLEEDIVNKIGININNREEMFETEAWMREAYLLCQENGSTYLLFNTLLADHDDTTYLYDITDGSIIKKEELEFTNIIKPINTNSLILLDILDIFGTYFGYSTYTLDDSTGKLVYPQLHYTNAESAHITLTLVRELPVVMHHEQTTLPAGTPLQITAINDNGIAHFCELIYGEEGEFYYTIDDSGAICIDGLEESFYFESLPYSG